MGLIALSVILAIILGCCLWLVIGDQLPPGEETKWPAANNIFVYAASLVLPVYLVIFFIF